MSSVHDRRPSVHAFLGCLIPAKAPGSFGLGIFDSCHDEATELSDAAMFEGWPDDNDDAAWEARTRYEDECERIALETERLEMLEWQRSECLDLPLTLARLDEEIADMRQALGRPFTPSQHDRAWWAELDAANAHAEAVIADCDAFKARHPERFAARKPFTPEPDDRGWWASEVDRLDGEDADWLTTNTAAADDVMVALASVPPPISGGSPDMLSQVDRERIEDEVMGHTEDLDARREWEGGAR